MTEKKLYRDAASGEYVTKEYADEHPDTTVAEGVAPYATDVGDAWVMMWAVWLVDGFGYPPDAAESIARSALEEFQGVPINTTSLAEVLAWLRRDGG